MKGRTAPPDFRQYICRSQEELYGSCFLIPEQDIIRAGKAREGKSPVRGLLFFVFLSGDRQECC
jgi:hypothetical protein